ncbi:MAG: flagellar basal body P-ring protein FlgI [Magnetococcales bacterium]|nr:flagellar basal body P-ring protein FlgI [Magnetococcales bacterium]
MLLLAGLLAGPSPAEAARLKDVVSIEGVRDNQLIGFGLVAGLNGTGDGKASFTNQSMVMMLERMGISSRDNLAKMESKNVAAVMVTATLPPFARQGSRVDVILSSLGGAKSLEGGTLILTPLRGPDGQIYAVAQGPVSIGGMGDAPQGTQKNHPTVGRITSGGIIEKEIAFDLNQERQLQLALKNSDFTTANRISSAINNLFGQPLAQSRDSGTVMVQLPESYQNRVVEFVARLENLQIESDTPARIVVNERTGTVVMGENVRVSSVALSHGNLNVRITPEVNPDQPPPVQTPQTQQARLIQMDEGITLGDLVRGLNSMGVSPRDLIAILQSIKAAGALQAELEIL